MKTNFTYATKFYLILMKILHAISICHFLDVSNFCKVAYWKPLKALSLDWKLDSPPYVHWGRGHLGRRMLNTMSESLKSGTLCHRDVYYYCYCYLEHHLACLKLYHISRPPLQAALISCCFAVYGILNVQEIDRYLMAKKRKQLKAYADWLKVVQIG